MEADEVLAPPRLEVHVDGAKFGWGGALASRHPWNKHAANMTAPNPSEGTDVLTALLKEFSRRLRDGGTLALHPNFTAAEDDPHLRWVKRGFSDHFPRLVALMIRHGLASSEAMAAAGTGKVRVRFDVAWDTLSSALEHPELTPQLREFVLQARQEIR